MRSAGRGANAIALKESQAANQYHIINNWVMAGRTSSLDEAATLEGRARFRLRLAWLQYPLPAGNVRHYDIIELIRRMPWHPV